MTISHRGFSSADDSSHPGLELTPITPASITTIAITAVELTRSPCAIPAATGITAPLAASGAATMLLPKVNATYRRPSATTAASPANTDSISGHPVGIDTPPHSKAARHMTNPQDWEIASTSDTGVPRVVWPPRKSDVPHDTAAANAKAIEVSEPRIR